MELKDRIKAALSSVPALVHPDGKINYKRVAEAISNQLADDEKVSRQSVMLWIEGKTKKITTSYITAICELTGYSLAWVANEKGTVMDPNISTSSPQSKQILWSQSEDGPLSSVEKASENDEVYGIEYYEAKGSCGGGIHNGQDRLAGKITRKASWFFRFFDVKPENCKAIYADGDSMADFIIDGDMVLFDISRRTPISGKIFLLRYPNGLRIKELYEQSMGKWKVKSRNPDYDDEEVVSPEDVEIIGQFIYRQGGIF